MLKYSGSISKKLISSLRAKQSNLIFSAMLLKKTWIAAVKRLRGRAMMIHSQYSIPLSFLLTISTAFAQTTLFTPPETQPLQNSTLLSTVSPDDFKKQVHDMGEKNLELLKQQAKQKVPEPPEKYPPRQQKPEPLPIQPSTSKQPNNSSASPIIQQNPVTNFSPPPAAEESLPTTPQRLPIKY